MKKNLDAELSDFRHDLRTPLTVMKCHIDLLLMKGEQGVDKEVYKVLKLLNKEVDRMTGLISKIKI